MTRLSNLGRATFLTLSSSFALFPISFSNAASASSSSSAVTEHKTVLVTASRLTEDSTSSSANVTIITGDEIRDSAASNLVDLLASKAGISKRSLFGGTKSATVGLRGFGSVDGQNTLILLDGRRLNDIDLTSADLSAIPINNIERIEIIRGGGSVLYGDGAVGGAINIITKSPAPGASNARAVVETGSDSHLSGSLDANMGSEDFAAHVFRQDSRNEGYRDNNDFWQNNTALDLRSYLASGELYLKTQLDQQSQRLPGARRVDRNTGLNELIADPSGATTPNNYARQQGESFTLGGVHELNPDNRLIVDVGFRDKDQQAFLDYGFSTSYVDTRLENLSFTPRYEARLGQTQLAAGVDRYQSDYQSDRSQTQSSAAIHDYSIEADSLSVFAQATSALTQQSSINYGARWQTIDYSAIDKLDTTAPGGAFEAQAPKADGSFDEPSLEAGYLHKLDQHHSVSFSASRAVRFVTVDEMMVEAYEPPTYAQSRSFALLTPQTSNNFELGWRFDDRNIASGISVYLMNLKDEITFDPSVFRNVNLDKTSRKGIELNHRHPLNERFVLDVNYGYQIAEFESGLYKGKDVPLVPAHNASIAVETTVFDTIKVATLWKFTGKRVMDNDQENSFEKIPAIRTLDFLATQSFGRLAVSYAFSNVLGSSLTPAYDYAVKSSFTPGVFNAYPLPERSANIRLSYDF